MITTRVLAWWIALELLQCSQLRIGMAACSGKCGPDKRHFGLTASMQVHKRSRSGPDGGQHGSLRSAVAAVLAPFTRSKHTSPAQANTHGQHARPAMLAHVLSYSAQRERQPSTAGR